MTIAKMAFIVLPLLVSLSAACGDVSPPAGDDEDAQPPDAVAQPPDAVTCVPTPPGLGARWRGENNTADDRGLFDGTAHGALAFTPGRHGSAFLLDGATAYVTADSGDTLWPTSSFSVAVWVKASSIGAVSQIFVKYGCGGSTACDGNDWEIDIDASGHAMFNVRVHASTGNVLLTDTVHSVVDGAWHYLAGVRDVTAEQLRLYVDGAVAATRAISGGDLGPMGNVDGVADPVTIGAYQRSGTDTFEGMFGGAIDDAAYYTAALTDGQVMEIYASPNGECP